MVDAQPSCGESACAVFFDLYGTLINIRTDEEDGGVYAALSEYLAYFRVWISPEELHQQYRGRVRAALAQRAGHHPEVDVYEVFRDLTSAYRAPLDPPGTGRPPDRWPADPDGLAVSVAVLFRALTRRSFEVFPGVPQVLDRLRAQYRLGLISDAQWVFTDPELEMTDLSRFFPVRVLSSRVGIKKPDRRIFDEAMRALGATPEQSVYVGDNLERDLVGAKSAGMRCVIFGAAGVEVNGLRPDACFQSYTDLEPILDAMLR